MEYFKKGVTAPDTSASHVKWDFSGLSRGDVWVGNATAAAAPAGGPCCGQPAQGSCGLSNLLCCRPPSSPSCTSICWTALGLSFPWCGLLDCTMLQLLLPASSMNGVTTAWLSRT